MSENYQENNHLPEQPLPEETSADPGLMLDAGVDKTNLPPVERGAGDALSDEKAVADHNDLQHIKFDALQEHAGACADAAAETSDEHRPAAAETIPVASPEQVPQEDPPQTQQLAVAAPTAVVQPVEVITEPAPLPQQVPPVKKKQGRKAFAVVIPLLILAIILAALTPTVILPEVRRMQAYSSAEDMLNTGMHDEAYAAFSALGDYRDARIMALESRYQKADYLTYQERYAEAISIWLELGSYSDSASRAEQAEFDWKDDDYQAAFRMMEEGQFLAAAEIFSSLGDYQSSISLADDCRMLQLEADYFAAETALAEGDYEAAINGFHALGDYVDAHERYLAASYEYGCRLLDEGSYEMAIRRLSDASGFEDANDKKIQAHYHYGCELLDGKNYEAAIAQLEKSGDYRDTANKILKAKYGYAQANMVRTNSTTRAYLKTLIAENYPGAQKLYNELFAWKVEIIAYNNSPYSTTNQSTISKYGPMCIHFKITGGEPGATIDLVGNLTAPNGQSGNIYFNSCADGDTQCAYFEYYQPAYGATGTMTLRVYDSDGKLMATGSVRVTN